MAATAREARARSEPLSVELLAPGLFEVRNLRSNRHHRVDVRDGPVCECPDFVYTSGPAGENCKHIEFVLAVANGELCSHCGRELCRPSCPNKEDRR